MNRDERGPWYLLTGLILGVVLGLVYAWWVQPVKYTDTVPASLRTEFKDQYRVLIAAAYLGNADLVRAQARLQLLKDPDMFRSLSEQAQRTLAENGNANDARALGLLAIALGQAAPGPAIAITRDRSTPPAQPVGAGVATGVATGVAPGATQAALDSTPGEPDLSATETGAGGELAASSPTAWVETAASESSTPPPAPQPSVIPGQVTPKPAAQPAAQPTAGAPLQASQAVPPTAANLPSATPGGPFLLLSREKVCDPPLAAPLIQIEALDRFNAPMPGTLVIVSWEGGEERFYTGLKPEKGPGYADFAPTPGLLYTLRLGENGQPEDNLAALVCIGPGGERLWGAWLLKFVQP